MDAAGIQAELADFALDALAIGIIATDRRLAIHYANAAAERLLDQPDGVLRRTGNLLATLDDRVHGKLKAMMTSGISSDCRLERRSRYLFLPAVASGLPVAICATPLRVMQNATGQPTTMLFVRTIERDCDLTFEARVMFGLTEMEANVASALASGLSLAGAAHANNVQLSTARWHLKNIFQKTGTRQQSQVAALLRGAQIPLR